MKRNRRKPKGDNRQGEKSRDMREASPQSKHSTNYGGNDLSWYSRYPNLLISAASVPYPYRPGMGVNLLKDTTMYALSNNKTEGHVEISCPTTLWIPGVMGLSWAPSVGVAQSSTDAINVAAKEMYAHIRKAYSGDLAVDPPDIMMYIMALDSIFAYIAALKRIYRVLTIWTEDNYQFPDGVLQALMSGTQAQRDALRANKVQLWQAINELVLQSRKFRCPALMDIFNRHYWLSDNIYSDAPTLRGQMYAFVPEYLFVFNELETTDIKPVVASALSYRATPWSHWIVSGQDPKFPQGVTVENFLTFGLNMIRALADWDDSYTISGYLQRAYDGVPSFVVEELPMDAIITPVYNEEVLAQIENYRCVPFTAVNQILNANVLQNVLTNNVISTHTWTPPEGDETNKAINYANVLPFVNVRPDVPSVADTVIATRMHNVLKALGNGKYQVLCGTELSLGMWVVDQYLTGYNRLESLEVLNMGSATVADNSSPVHLWYELDNYDWHPIIVRATQITTGGTFTLTTSTLQLQGDIRNLTVMDDDVVANIHRVCVLSEFNAFSNN